MEASIDSYMTLIKEIHTTLAEHSHLVTNYRPFARSPYAAIKQSELADAKLQIVRKRIQEMVGEVEAQANEGDGGGAAAPAGRA